MLGTSAMKYFHTRSSIGWLAVALALLACCSRAAYAGDWPQFRGPEGQGHSAEKGLPLTWSESENIAWKTPIPGLGWSSPVIRGRQLWITTADETTGSLRALCLDAKTGRIAADIELFRKRDLGPINPKNSHASPTPVIDGDRIYVHYGAHGTACLSDRGEIVWRTEELAHDHRHGPGGSPVVWRDLLIVNCDGADKQFIVALDKLTGRVRWRTDRPGKMAYSTPLVVSVDGADQIISPAGERVAAYVPATGEEIWSLRHGGDSVVLRPVVGHGLVFVSSGYTTTALYAIDLHSRGAVSGADAAWTLRRGIPYDPSPLLVGTELYLVSDQGVMSCLDARSGKPQWQSRLGGNYSASPLSAAGRIYLSSEEGLTTVLAPGSKLQKLAENQLDGRIMASLATSDRAIFLRTDKALYRIEEQSAPTNPAPAAAQRSASAARR